MTAKDPRDSGRWRRLRAQIRAGVTNCNQCGRALDHTRPRASTYPTLDHIVPLAHGGDPFDRNNIRVICGGCNSRKSARIRNGTATPTRAPIAPMPPTRQVCPGHGADCPGWHSQAW